MYTIAITGVGGGVGQSILKALDNTDYNLVSLDGDFLGAGLYASEKGYKIPYAMDGNYINALLEICKRESCDLLFPGLDAELSPLSLHQEKFQAIGTKVVISRKEIINLSDDKLETFKQLTSFGIKVPNTIAAEEIQLGNSWDDFPIVLKQRTGGARSKNVYIVKDSKELDRFLLYHGTELSQYIVQEYIEGDEYTCGSICLDNKCMGVIVLRRILRDGDTYKCFVERNSIIEELVRTIVDRIQPFGAFNVQLKFDKGVPYVFEVNARCSGTTATRAICGFNEPLMIADFILKGKNPSFTIEEKTILRYWNELPVQNDDINTLQKQGFLIRKNYTRL